MSVVCFGWALKGWKWELTFWATAPKASNARVKKREKPMLSGGNEEGRRRGAGGKVAGTCELDGMAYVLFLH